MKYIKDQKVRCRYGCVWLFGIIDEVCSDDFYEVSYGSRKQFERCEYGYPLNFFAHFHESDLMPINP